MFGWRRRSEGFEWREYVRTTVLVRRADRQRRIDEARVAAIDKVKDARDKGVAAGQAGLSTLTDTVSDLAVAVVSATWAMVRSAATTFWQIATAVAREIAARLPGRSALPKLPQLPAMPRLSLPKITLPKIDMPSWPPPKSGAGQRADVKGAEAPAPRKRGVARDDDVTAAEAPLRPDVPFRWPVNPRLIGGAALVGAIIFIVGPMLEGGAEFSQPQSVATVKVPPQETGAISPSESGDAAAGVHGRARAIRGDLLRVDGQIVKLASIESPAAQHPCMRSNGRKWNCSAAASIALRRMVRGKTVDCTTSGVTDAGHLIGKCTIDGTDIADELVRKGHVFASEGFFATYGASEKEAQANKVGVWQGDTVRPEAWRSQVWEEAKQARPDGCPIKGFVRSSSRTYAMPWSRDYDRQKLRERRGDRWFCSEEEARSAGFTLAGSL